MTQVSGYRAFCWVTVVLATLLAPSFSPADGVYLPPRAFPKLPEIPSQTAIIAYDQGVETLVVESTMNASQGDRFAWIVPLPVEPTKIEKASPGIIKSVRNSLGSYVHSDSQLIGFGNAAQAASSLHIIRNALLPSWPFFVLASFFWTLGLMRKSNPVPFLENKPALIFFFLGILVLLTFGPGVLKAGYPDLSRSQMREIRREHVGNYSVVVVRATSIENLGDWLKDNGFADIPTGAKPILEDHIRQKWCFLAARLNRKGSEVLTPHPLKVTFPAPGPIYPMRLTALAGSRTELHLYVVGQTPFSHELLQTTLADRFTTSTKPILAYSGSGVDANASKDCSSTLGVHIGHPAFLDLLAAGAWITCLEGTLAPSDMDKDILLTQARPGSKPYQEILWTAPAALRLSGALALGLLALLCPVIGLVFRASPKGRWALALVFITAMLLGVAVFLALHRTSDFKVVSDFGRVNMNLQWNIIAVFQKAYSQSGIANEAMEQDIRKDLSNIINPYADAPLIEEDSPGNYQFGKDGKGRLTLIHHDETGTPIELSWHRERKDK